MVWFIFLKGIIMRKNVFIVPFCVVVMSFFSGFSQSAFINLSLKDAIELGLKNNPEIKSSYQKIGASRGRLLSAFSPASPDISITHDYIPMGQNINRYGEKTVGVSQPIEFPTSYFLRGSKYSIEKAIAENEFALTRLAIISNIKRSYFNVLALLEQVKIAQENLEIAQDFVCKAEIRHAVGEGANLEKLTAKVTYTEARNNVEIQKNHLAAAFAELNFALGNGKEESKTLLLADTLAFIPFDFTLSRLTDDAMAANPALKAGKLRVDSYSKEKLLAWSSLLPTFNLGYFNKQVRDDAKGYYGASLSIGIPLWFMLDQRGRILEASSNVSSAEAEFKTANNDVYAKTQAAFAEFKHEENQVRLYVQDILPQAQEIFLTASKSYEAGEITYMEFLQAQQTLIHSKGSYAEALLSYNLSIVTIEEAIGKTLQ